MKTALPNGPTKNKSFNQCLVDWAKSGHICLPKCEDCECDLTDKEVYDTNSNWLCERCFNYSQDNYSGTSHAQDAAAERRQMGMVD